MIALNGRILRMERFANKEAKFKDFDDCIAKGWNILEFKYTCDEDLIALMFAKKHIDEFNVPCVLFIGYMPYGRMDRKIDGNLFTLQYVASFINWLDFVKVIVMEPHSDKTMQLLKRARAVYPVKDWLPIVQAEVGFGENDHVVFPDKGAALRYAGSDYANICVFQKRRNPITDVIEEMHLKEGKINPGSKCIIIDDICSKGETLAGAAKILKAAGASEIYVIVSHCEEAILHGNLLDEGSIITKVYTSKSIISQEHPKIEYMDVDVIRYVDCEHLEGMSHLDFQWNS